MFSVLHAAESGMTASNLWLNAISSNMANSQTPGYGQRLVGFGASADVVSRSAGRTVGAQTVQPALGYTPGAFMTQDAPSFASQIISASSAHDVAVNGPGFLVVKTASGSLAYTRDGSLQVDAKGQIGLPGGTLLEPPVTVPPGESWQVAPDGAVMAGPAGQAMKPIGQIAVALIPNPEGMVSVGSNLYQLSPASGPAVAAAPGTAGRGLLQVGALNGSGVSLASQMVDMIQAQTAYSVSAKVIAVQETLSKGLTQIVT